MKKKKKLVDPKVDLKDEEEVVLDKTLRPSRMSDVVGREKEKCRVNILVGAAKKRKEPVDHVLFYGPPGLGKTMLAHVIANEVGTRIYVTSGPAVGSKGDLASLLTTLEARDVLFIDEIHRLRREVEEFLYPALEEFRLDLSVGKGPSAKVIRLDLAPFTLVGATTRIGLLSSPLRDRFGLVQRLDFYSEEELIDIVLRGAEVLGVEINRVGAKEVAKRSRGTARVSLRLLRRVRDYADVHNIKKVDNEVVEKAMEIDEIDEIGLDPLGRKILEVLIKHFLGGPVGIETLAAAVSEEVDTLTDVYEPFLLQQGLLKRTFRGRVATPKAYQHLKLGLG